MQNWAISLLLRTIILFLLTLVIVRVIGKVNLAKVTPFKFVSYIVIAVIAASISLGLIQNIAFGFIVLATWVLLSLALDYLSLRSKLIHDFVNGRETILMKDGKVMEENLIDVRYTGEELLRELRSKNAFNLADVEFAVMESTGEVNVLLKSDKKPVTSHDLQRKVSPLSEPETVILDGNILDESLKNRGLDREWLKVQLSGLGVSLDNVFIGQVDSSGDLFIDIFDDSIQITQPQVKELLYASISKVQSDLLTFSLETNDLKMRKMYSNNANQIKKMMDKLEPYLLR
ncbi:DUF421 domain-containing protein [Clostridium sp.]|jgi:uncharacterized membrane protein YcaP (DUF421 family)|uniref:DUF421 domain-containing protein n=1 Tax=Clostridium sp. TaxID=1506 RepID=UPI00258F4B93|nr:DUF421 domain-containing protein [Clostridium sp.]MDF2504900.1 putative rane protein [Clostridium sp.]